MDVLTLEQALHAVQEVVEEQVVESRVVLDCFLVQGRQSLDSRKGQVVGQGRLIGCDVLKDSVHIHPCNGFLGDLGLVKPLLILSVLLHTDTHSFHVGNYCLDAFLVLATWYHKIQDPRLFSIDVSPDKGN